MPDFDLSDVDHVMSDLDDVSAVVGYFLLRHAVHRSEGGKVDGPPLRQLFHYLPSEDVVRGNPQACRYL